MRPKPPSLGGHSSRAPHRSPVMLNPMASWEDMNCIPRVTHLARRSTFEMATLDSCAETPGLLHCSLSTSRCLFRRAPLHAQTPESKLRIATATNAGDFKSFMKITFIRGESYTLQDVLPRNRRPVRDHQSPTDVRRPGVQLLSLTPSDAKQVRLPWRLLPACQLP